MDKLKAGIVEFYRSEMARRYELDNLRRFDNFEDVSDETAAALRSYFMDHIYPPISERRKLDNAVNHLGDMLTSPWKLTPLMGAGLLSLITLGTHLRAAVQAGMATRDAYLEARRLEDALAEAAESRDLSASDTNSRTKMIGLLHELPSGRVEALVRDVARLFRALSDTRMLEIAVSFLDRCAEIMKKRPDLYSSADVAGIRLGRQMLAGGLDLFREIEPALFPKIIRGIEEVERDWYHAAMAEAAE